MWDLAARSQSLYPPLHLLKNEKVRKESYQFTNSQSSHYQNFSESDHRKKRDEKTERKDDRNSSMGSLEEFLEQFIEKSPNKK